MSCTWVVFTCNTENTIEFIKKSKKLNRQRKKGKRKKGREKIVGLRFDGGGLYGRPDEPGEAGEDIVCSSARRRRRGLGKQSHNAHFKPRTRSSSPRSSLSSPSSSSSGSRRSSHAASRPSGSENNTLKGKHKLAHQRGKIS